MDPIFIMEVLFPIFAIIGLGYAFRRLSIVGENDIDVLNGYAYYIGFPALMFVSLYTTDFADISDPRLYLVNVGNALVMMCAVFGICTAMKVKRELKGVIVMASYFGNNAYMGFPVSQLAFGDGALPYAAIISGINIALALTVGLFLINLFAEKERPSVKWAKEIGVKLLKVPLLWGVIFGILCSFVSSVFRTQLEDPPVAGMLDNLAFVQTALVMLKSTASPVALFALGAFLFGRLPRSNFIEMGIVNFSKLALAPIVVILLCFVFGLGAIQHDVSLAQAAMPMAVTNFVVAKKYKIQDEFVANSVVATTAVSIITIPIFLGLFA